MADVIFNPNTPRQVRLQLAPREGQGDRGRAWEETRMPRKAVRGQNAGLEGTLEWLSWHGGMGHGRVIETGTMPPIAASCTLDIRYQYLALLPPKRHTVTGTYATRFVFEHASYLWSVGKNADGTQWQLAKIDPATGAVTSTQDLGSSNSGQPYSVVTFDGVAYIGMGLAVNVWKIASDGTTITQATGSVMWQYAAVIGAKLYFNTTVNVVRNVSSGADPFNTANWSGVISTGDSIPITSLSGLVRVLYIGREDGLNGLDTDLNLVNLLPELKQYQSSENVRSLMSWHGAMVVQHARGLFYYTEGLVQQVGTERMKTNTTVVQGVIRGLAADGEWLWAMMEGPETAEGDFRYFLMCGRERTGQEAGEGPMAWFVLAEMTATTALNANILMTVSSRGNMNRLWFPDPTTGRAAWMRLSDLNAPPREPGHDGDFESEGTLTLPVVNMGQPMVPKYLKSVEIAAKNLAAGRTVTVWYAADPESAEPTWTQIPGELITDGHAELLFQDDLLVSETQLQLRLGTDDATESPVLERVALNYVERPERVTVVSLSAIAGPTQHTRYGAEMPGNGVDVRNRLYAMEGAGPQTLIDPWGQRGTWLVHDVKVTEAEYREAPSQPSLAIQMTLQKVT